MKSLSFEQMSRVEGGNQCNRLERSLDRALAKGNLVAAFFIYLALIFSGCGNDGGGGGDTPT